MTNIVISNNSSEDVEICMYNSIGKVEKTVLKKGVVFKNDYNEICKVIINSVDEPLNKIEIIFHYILYIFVALLMLLLGESSQFLKNVSLPVEITVLSQKNEMRIELTDNRTNKDYSKLLICTNFENNMQPLDNGLLKKQFFEIQILLALEFLIGITPVIILLCYSISASNLVLTVFSALVIATLFFAFLRIFRKNYKDFKNLQNMIV